MLLEKYRVSVSIVLYNDTYQVLKKILNSFLDSTIEVKIFLIDNSKNDNLKIISNEFLVTYIHSPSNKGYGYANNLAIFNSENQSDYHIVCNSDIYFNSELINSLLRLAINNKKIGLIMPKILYPNGSTQNLIKTLPTPFTFIRKRVFNDSNSGLINMPDKVLLNVPYLSGCFMFFKTSVLKNIGGFDDKYFLHFEDVDITRRVLDYDFLTLYYPKLHIYHDHIYKRSTNLQMMLVYLKSAFRYFCKWGFISDNQRRIYNKNIIVIN